EPRARRAVHRARGAPRDRALRLAHRSRAREGDRPAGRLGSALGRAWSELRVAGLRRRAARARRARVAPARPPSSARTTALAGRPGLREPRARDVPPRPLEAGTSDAGGVPPLARARALRGRARRRACDRARLRARPVLGTSALP